VESSGLHPKYKHINASSGMITHPEMNYNLVRPGIIIYGLSPNPDDISLADIDLKPALKLEAKLINVKDIPGNQGVSYGFTYHTKSSTRIGIVPLGYADGILRSASGSDTKTGAPVYIPSDQKFAPVVGRICMDQFMIDLGRESRAKTGDWVTVFDGTRINDWAKSADTINYEILTKLMPHIPRVYQGLDF
jgi:alanine racemase